MRHGGPRAASAAPETPDHADALGPPSPGHRAVNRSAHEPNLRFRVIEGAGHWVTLKAAEEINNALLDVLR